MPLSAEQVYAKDHKLKRDEVSALLQWTKTQPHLPEVTEMQAILALHSNYYHMEAAMQTIDKYFTTRTLYPEYFSPAPPDVVQRVCDVNFFQVLPKKTPEDDIVVMMKFLQSNPKLFNCIDCIRVSVMVLTLHIHQFGPANGLILLLGMEDVSFGHLFRMNLIAVKRMMAFLQEAAPVRIKGLHFVNTGTVTGKLLAVLKPFIKKEVAEAIRLHSRSLESLYEFVPRECLPRNYGGELPSVEDLHREGIRRLLENLEFLDWHYRQKVDESKRLRA